MKALYNNVVVEVHLKEKKKLVIPSVNPTEEDKKLDYDLISSKVVSIGNDVKDLSVGDIPVLDSEAFPIHTRQMSFDKSTKIKIDQMIFSCEAIVAVENFDK